MIPEPQMPVIPVEAVSSSKPASFDHSSLPITRKAGSSVCGSILTRSIAPGAARWPLEICAPSKAGPVGEDVMSRVSYSMMNPGGDAEMTAAVRGALNELATATAEEAGIEVSDILDITLVSNPIMHHLLLGMDPVELGGAPFALATDFGTRIKARELEIGLHPGAGAYVCLLYTSDAADE